MVLRFKKPNKNLFLILFLTFFLTITISLFNHFKVNLFASGDEFACYTACLDELDSEWEEADCNTFCFNHDYAGYYDPGGCAEGSDSYGNPDVGIWCSYVNTNKEMCTGACRSQNWESTDSAQNCLDICNAYSTEADCKANIGTYLDTNPIDLFCSYLEYARDPIYGISFTNTTRGVLTVTTPGTDNVTGTVITESDPDTIVLSDGDTYNQSCTYEEVDTNTWDFSCSTSSLPDEGVYLYYVTVTTLDLTEY
ncbi:MAG: hypothetical protein RBS01_01225, partial [Candidatus Dojkabacteria bacterium]|nr:hypothetical protein [Candidatus Dojkabacteria bacterium]